MGNDALLATRYVCCFICSHGLMVFEQELRNSITCPRSVRRSKFVNDRGRNGCRTVRIFGTRIGNARIAVQAIAAIITLL